MSKCIENGVIRDATPEEIAEWEQQEKIPQILTDSQRLDALEIAIKEGLKL